jgi:hypothetical protein
MQGLTIWCAITLASFAGAAGAYHSYLLTNPLRIALVLDSSYEMRADFAAAKRLAVELNKGDRYALFGLFSEKSRVHGYADKLNLDRLKSYSPRRFDSLQSGPLRTQLDNADGVVLITNADASETKNLPSNWQILNP